MNKWMCLKNRTGKKSPVWKGGKKEYKCVCGKTFKRYSKDIYPQGNKYCSKGCAGKDLLLTRGKNYIVKHHVYLKCMGKPNLILRLVGRLHNKLHMNAYNYLVDNNQVEKYIQYFYKKNKLGRIKYYGSRKRR